MPTPRDNTRYWTLPTGSRISYSVYEPPPGVPGRPEPIVFVHGGPGFKTFDTDHAFYSQFANDGFRVYLFDQAGAGLSGPLPRASEYSVERFVADLEAIREKIGSDRLILIGQSWGGTLIAHYAVAHPNHVAKLIFHSRVRHGTGLTRLRKAGARTQRSSHCLRYASWQRCWCHGRTSTPQTAWCLSRSSATGKQRDWMRGS